MQHRAFRSNLFTAAVLLPRCFFLSTDTDVGGSKQKHVLLSETCYQTCTRMYRFDKRSQKPHLHYTCGKKDFCFNRCPGERVVKLWIKTICFHLKKYFSTSLPPWMAVVLNNIIFCCQQNMISNLYKGVQI